MSILRTSGKSLVVIAAFALLTGAKGEGCSISVDDLEDELAAIESHVNGDDLEDYECPEGEMPELICEDDPGELEGPDGPGDEGPPEGGEGPPEEGPPGDGEDDMGPPGDDDFDDACEVICVLVDDDWDDEGPGDGGDHPEPPPGDEGPPEEGE
ncbi:hypothetical protein JYT28_01260 [Desulfobulbus sp. AH-315-M07]|nr:hypothetical protein [Desulfobulbus sp. AH-315-M07]